MNEEDLRNIFTYHAPSGEQVTRYNALREAARGFALVVNTCCPDSREKSLAITNIQQAVMWANASIALEK